MCFYGYSGKIFPSGIAADSYKKAVNSAIQKLRSQEASHDSSTAHDVSVLAETASLVFFILTFFFSKKKSHWNK